MTLNNKFPLLVLITVIMLSAGMYVAFVRPLVLQLLEGTAPAWAAAMAEALYPRLSAEFQRLSPSFFLQKADQVVVRFGIVVTCFCCWWQYKTQLFQVFALPSPSSKHITYLRAGFYGFIFITTYDWWGSIPVIVEQETFYKPISFLRLFYTPLPSVATLRMMYLLLLLSAGLAVAGWKPRWTGYFTIALFIVLQGFFTSFEKSDHGYVTYIYAGLLFPLVFETGKAQQVLVLFSIRAVIALSYLMAGIEKLLSSGLSWLHPTTFKTYLTMHDTPAGQWVAHSELLCVLLPLFAMLFQLTFPATLFLKKSRYYWLGAGIVFHWGTVVLFGISSFINPWVIVYIFFLDEWRAPCKSIPTKTGINTTL